MRKTIVATASPSSGTLVLPGTLLGIYHVFYYLRGRYLLPRSLYNLFLETVAARFETDGGYLYRRDSIACDGNPDAVGMPLLRIRQRTEPEIIESHLGCLLLSVPRHEIVIGRALFDLKPEVVDPHVLKRLRDALEDK